MFSVSETQNPIYKLHLREPKALTYMYNINLCTFYLFVALIIFIRYILKDKIKQLFKKVLKNGIWLHSDEVDRAEHKRTC